MITDTTEAPCTTETDESMISNVLLVYIRKPLILEFYWRQGEFLLYALKIVLRIGTELPYKKTAVRITLHLRTGAPKPLVSIGWNKITVQKNALRITSRRGRAD